MKLCINCKWCLPVKWLRYSALCNHPDVRSVVDGKADDYCEGVRINPYQCGPNAKFFEEKNKHKAEPKNTDWPYVRGWFSKP